ncbi:hypothetical protein KMP12_01165 [Gemella sp. zg-1178]|nr:hypothetical protein [Gemella sp. zg-1178]
MGYESSDDEAEVGGGSYPASYLESVAVKLSHEKISSTQLEKYLLEVEIPIITRIKDNTIIFDMRTLASREFDLVLGSLKKIIKISLYNIQFY